MAYAPVTAASGRLHPMDFKATPVGDKRKYMTYKPLSLVEAIW